MIIWKITSTFMSAIYNFSKKISLEYSVGTEPDY